MSIFLIKIFSPPASLYVYIIYTYYQLFPLWWITYYHFLVTKLIDNVWGSLSSALRLKKWALGYCMRWLETETAKVVLGQI